MPCRARSEIVCSSLVMYVLKILALNWAGPAAFGLPGVQMAGSFMGAVPGSRPFQKMPRRTTSNPSEAMDAASTFESTLTPAPLVTISYGGSLYMRSTPCMRTTRPSASRRKDPPGVLMGAAGPGITGDVVVALAEPEAAHTTIATSAADTPTVIALRGVGAPTPRRTTGWKVALSVESIGCAPSVEPLPPLRTRLYFSIN